MKWLQTVYSKTKKRIIIPKEYDYIGIYLTDKCHLNCAYCITRHDGAPFGSKPSIRMNADCWIAQLNRMVLPEGIPITIQGGEPFLFDGIWEILENVHHKIDILTALPSFVTGDKFLKLKTLAWNKRSAPYPTIRVSYHIGQNNYKELIQRIAGLQKILSIGLYYLAHPCASDGDFNEVKAYAQQYGVELRTKEFLGKWNGHQYGTYLYPEAVRGQKNGLKVHCKNSVVPIAPDGTIYRCHSDLYFGRRALALGNVCDHQVEFPEHHLDCDNFGLCSACDVKVKTNHLQVFGYTSVDIRFPNVKANKDE